MYVTEMELFSENENRNSLFCVSDDDMSRVDLLTFHQGHEDQSGQWSVIEI